MGKKILSFFISLFVIVTLNSLVYSQDATVDKKSTTDTTKTETKTTDVSGNMKDVKEDGNTKNPGGITKTDVTKEETAQLPKQNPKVYFDGYVTFVNTLVMFKLSSKDNILEDKIFYRIDKTDFVIYNGPFAVKEEGNHSISYYSIDKMGNKEATNKILNFITDNTPPSVIVTTNYPVLKDKLYASDNLLFTIAAKDDLSGVGQIEYSTDGTNFVNYDKPFSIKAETPLDLKVRVKDNVDNASEKYTFMATDENGQMKEISVGSLKVHVDKKAPVVTIASDKNFEVKDGKNIASMSYKYIVSATDEDSGVKEILVKVDGIGDYQLYKRPIEFSENGEHKIEAIAKDKVGNVSQPVILNIFVDTTPPDSEIKLITEK